MTRNHVTTSTPRTKVDRTPMQNDHGAVFGRVLRYLRERQGLTQEEVLQRLDNQLDTAKLPQTLPAWYGHDAPWIWRLEGGTVARLNRELVCRLATALDLTGPERSALLLSAGFSPYQAARGMSGTEAFAHYRALAERLPRGRAMEDRHASELTRDGATIAHERIGGGHTTEGPARPAGNSHHADAIRAGVQHPSESAQIPGPRPVARADDARDWSDRVSANRLLTLPLRPTLRLQLSA